MKRRYLTLALALLLALVLLVALAAPASAQADKKVAFAGMSMWIPTSDPDPAWFGVNNSIHARGWVWAGPQFVAGHPELTGWCTATFNMEGRVTPTDQGEGIDIWGNTSGTYRMVIGTFDDYGNFTVTPEDEGGGVWEGSFIGKVDTTGGFTSGLLANKSVGRGVSGAVNGWLQKLTSDWSDIEGYYIAK